VCGHRLLDELRLPTGAVRCHHHAPCDGVRHLGAVVGAHYVQAEVDPRRHPRRRQDRALVDVEHARVDGHSGVAGREPVRVRPVRRRPVPVEHAGLAEDERARADGHHAHPAPCGRGERGQHRLRHRRLGVGPPRNDDGVRLLQGVEAEGHADGNAAGHRYGARREAAQQHAVARPAAVRARIPEDLGRDHQIEGDDVGEGQHGHGVQVRHVRK